MAKPIYAMQRENLCWDLSLDYSVGLYRSNVKLRKRLRNNLRLRN